MSYSSAARSCPDAFVELDLCWADSVSGPLAAEKRLSTSIQPQPAATVWGRVSEGGSKRVSGKVSWRLGCWIAPFCFRSAWFLLLLSGDVGGGDEQMSE